jgi:hypothetical protein
MIGASAVCSARSHAANSRKGAPSLKDGYV